MESGKDLAAVLGELKDDLAEIKKTAEETSNTLKETIERIDLIESSFSGEQADRLAFMSKCMKAGKTMKECSALWEKQQKAYAAPKGGATAEGFEKESELFQDFIGEKISEDLVDEIKVLVEAEQYPATAIGKILKYLEARIGKEFTRRMFNYIVRTLGAKKEGAPEKAYGYPKEGEKETEEAKPPVIGLPEKITLQDEYGVAKTFTVLPQAEKAAETSIDEIAEEIMRSGIEHQIEEED